MIRAIERDSRGIFWVTCDVCGTFAAPSESIAIAIRHALAVGFRFCITPGKSRFYCEGCNAEKIKQNRITGR